MADWKLGYFSTMAPLVVKNHVIAGVSGDVTDIPGFLLSVDPETGKMQWKWNTAPNKGQAGIRDMAGRGRRHQSRRRHDLDDRHVRSRVEPGLLGHRQSESGAGRRRPARATICAPARLSR